MMKFGAGHNCRDVFGCKGRHCLECFLTGVCLVLVNSVHDIIFLLWF